MNRSNKRRKIFFTSDWHIGHKNVIVFDERPFKDVNHMTEVLIANYNASVGEKDVCYFLGDMGLCKAEELKKVLNRLKGIKVLLLGNHDRNMYSMYDQGFDVVINTASFYIGDKRITMSHCPLPGIKREEIINMKGATEGENWHGEFKNNKFISYDKSYDAHLHGHIHSDGKIKLKNTNLQFDVGVRANKYRPVSISEIESWISKAK